MDNNGKNFSVIKMEVHNNNCHYEERSDEVIQGNTRIFGLPRKYYCHYEERSDEVIHSNTRIFWDCHENLRFSRNDKCMFHADLISEFVFSYILKYLEY